MRKPQINFELSEQDRWIIELLAAAEGSSVAAMAKREVEAYVAKRKKEAGVQRLMTAAADVRGQVSPTTGAVTPFERRRRPKPTAPRT